MLLHQKIGGSAAGQQTTKAQPVAHSARVFFEEFARGRAHRKFPQSGPLHFAAGAIKLGSGIFGAAQTLKPLSAVINDVGHVREGLDIVHDGRLAPQSGHLRIGRFRTRVGALAFERVEQSRLLAAHVPAGADVKIHLQAVPRVQDVFAQVSGGVSLRESARASLSCDNLYSPRMKM